LFNSHPKTYEDFLTQFDVKFEDYSKNVVLGYVFLDDHQDYVVRRYRGICEELRMFLRCSLPDGERKVNDIPYNLNLNWRSMESSSYIEATECMIELLNPVRFKKYKKNFKDMAQNGRAKKILLSIIVILTIFISYYTIKEHYFFAGHQYVGVWMAGQNHIKISHEENHFIVSIGTQGILSAHLTKYGELEINDSGWKGRSLTYLASDDAIQFNKSYYKRQ